MHKNSINKVILVGHIGNTPEKRYTPSGSSTCTFSLATNEVWLDSEKGRQERTEWHSIVAWNKQADFVAEYLTKGQLVYIEGRLQTRKWTDKNENIRKTTEVISSMITPLDWKKTKNANANEGDKNNDENENLKDDLDTPF